VKAKSKKRIFNLTIIGLIISVIPLLTGLVNFFLLRPIQVQGYWFAIDPSYATGINKAYNGECVFLLQDDFSEAVSGSFMRWPDEIYFVGQASRSQLVLNYIAYRDLSSKTDKEESAFGQMLLTKISDTELRGFWKEEVSQSGRLAGPGRWLLFKESKTACEDPEGLQKKYDQYEYKPNN